MSWLSLTPSYLYSLSPTLTHLLSDTHIQSNPISHTHNHSYQRSPKFMYPSNYWYDLVGHIELYFESSFFYLFGNLICLPYLLLISYVYYIIWGLCQILRNDKGVHLPVQLSNLTHSSTKSTFWVSFPMLETESIEIYSINGHIWMHWHGGLISRQHQGTTECNLWYIRYMINTVKRSWKKGRWRTYG